ncbi:hypothetical protein CK501_03515 [Halovibrio salipaludis]|uniref:Uncharacterized protein n=1 Tax=Halovibrio salipaludis TaxID=2032626 RepID=A0A2A2FCE2_9GAMM|nr:hypothetical protein [Halovibrio salipaludis]PAU82223.1 hypothetical protein CK501_03515 [Halovibrio salipaludis]
MRTRKHLKSFDSDEILLDGEEARTVLYFIFTDAEKNLIDRLEMDEKARGYAQGLLVEAIDASYSIGYLEKLFRSAANPTKGAVKLLKSFAKKASKQWFKHASASDLQNVRVYQFVVDHLATQFKSELRILLASERELKTSAFFAYTVPRQGLIKVVG